MTTSSFGRRQGPHSAASRPALGEDARASAALAALRLEMESVRGEDAAFQGWRRDQQLGRWLAWIASFALLTPGVICFMAHAPAAVSSALEVVGVVGGWALRRARRQRLSAIRDWAPDEFA